MHQSKKGNDWHFGMKAHPVVADGSGTAKALDHALKRWPALVRYIDSGTYPIDNNAVENTIRPIAIGKKNWLFTGSERAGRRAAAIQSLVATAKLNGLDPMRWLTETLEKLPTCPNSQIDSLLSFAQTTGK
jgi:transposase